MDEGCIPLSGEKDVAGFVENLGKLRLWDREPKVKMK